MQLSIVIVNYNVQYFLEQCLLSVQRACQNLSHEIFVVDNASKDDSVEMVRIKFPLVKLIANADNPGFSKANNQAITQAQGEFVLILNPDTVVAEDTFLKCISFMESQPQAGALGTKMIDGKGNFLPESKRALPTPEVAFYKIFGLAALFPKSKKFGRYHLGFLSKDDTHEVEILSGAFMFFRKKVLDKIGYFDESFFMYGEDIDLSYRVIKAGYKNFYFADTTIIHYKGESTKKGSLNYVKVFYEAMLIFARKHFASGRAKAFSFLINLAVVFRALLTVLVNVLSSSYLFLIDAVFTYAGLCFIISFWANNIKNAPEYYPFQFLGIIVPAYVLLWGIATFFSGGYEKPFRTFNFFRGIALGTIIIAALYAFLPESWRFSRAIILLGSFWSAVVMLLTRLSYNILRHGQFAFERHQAQRTLVLATDEEGKRAHTILQNVSPHDQVVASIAAKLNPDAILQYSLAFQAGEVVYSSSLFSFAEIIAATEKTGNKADVKILNLGSDALIGSNSKNTAGDLYAAILQLQLAKPLVRRKKRLLDIAIGLLFLPFIPFAFLFVNSLSQFCSNWWQVLSGEKTWVGYWITKEDSTRGLPLLQQAVVSSGSGVATVFSAEEIHRLNFLYAKNYRFADDLNLLWQKRNHIGG